MNKLREFLPMIEEIMVVDSFVRKGCKRCISALTGYVYTFFTLFVISLQTLDLLCHITNASNVETVCEKLLAYLKSTTDADVHFKTEFVDRITELSERYPLKRAEIFHFVKDGSCT